MRSNVLNTLGKINKRFDYEEPLPSVLPEATEGGDSSGLDDYLYGIALALMNALDLGSEDEAVDSLFEALDEMAEEGEIPPVPADDANEAEESDWVQGAQSYGLQDAVIDWLSDDSSDEE